MIDIQHDNVDINARRDTPLMIELAESVKENYSEDEQKDINDMIMLLTGWQGKMGADSVAASVYSVH